MTTTMMISTVGGVVSAQRGSRVLQGLFNHHLVNDDDNHNKNNDNMIVTGKDAPCMPYDPLPEWLVHYRTERLEAFCNDRNIIVSHDESNTITSSNVVENETNQKEDEDDAMDQIVSRILGISQDHSVDILAIGPLTNISHWLKHCEKKNRLNDFVSKVHSIYILGGNHPCPSSRTTIQTEPEFNFGLDPEAAHHVLMCQPLQEKIHLVTSSVCGMKQLREAVGVPQVQAFLDDHRQQEIIIENCCGFFRTLLTHDTVGYSLSCDPVCAFVMEYPDAVEWETIQACIDATSGRLTPPEQDQRKSTTTTLRMATSIDFERYLSWVGATIHSKQVH